MQSGLQRRLSDGWDASGRVEVLDHPGGRRFWSDEAKGRIVVESHAQTVRVVVATKPVDFRKGHDGLAATLVAIAAGHPKSRIDDLLPWNFQLSSS